MENTQVLSTWEQDATKPCLSVLAAAGTQKSFACLLVSPIDFSLCFMTFLHSLPNLHSTSEATCFIVILWTGHWRLELSSLVNFLSFLVVISRNSGLLL